MDKNKIIEFPKNEDINEDTVLETINKAIDIYNNREDKPNKVIIIMLNNKNELYDTTKISNMKYSEAITLIEVVKFNIFNLMHNGE